MTPMIDVVFLLIVFFMTVTQVSEANREVLELPQLKGSKDQSPQTLVINVTADETVIISGNPVSLTDVVRIARGEIAGAGGNPDMVSVVIRADQKGTSRPVNDIVDAMSRLQIKRVRFAVQVP